MATGASTSSARSSNIEPNEHSTTPSLLCGRPSCLGVPYHEFGACAPNRADYTRDYTELFDEVFDSLVASVSHDVLDQHGLPQSEKVEWYFSERSKALNIFCAFF